MRGTQGRGLKGRLGTVNGRNSVEILNAVLRRLYRSMLQYVHECWPWTHRGDGTAYPTVLKLREEELEDAKRLAELIVARGGAVATGSYPTEFVDTHFLALDYLLDELVRAERRRMEATEADLARLGGDAEAAGLLREILRRELEHLGVLQRLAGEHRYPEHALSRVEG